MKLFQKLGKKISKIKNLEDDIALSLSALGIRIIAPIPEKEPLVLKFPTKIQKWLVQNQLLPQKNS